MFSVEAKAQFIPPDLEHFPPLPMAPDSFTSLELI
jgi:hypothetical protein